LSVPEEYITVKNLLSAFRKKIFRDMVGGRVVAGLDASHDSMQKYSDVIEGLSVTPYLFGKVREKALALKLGTVHVDEGELRQAQLKYSVATVEYPLTPPYNISRRKLPQVDVFSFTPVTDLDLLDKVNVESFKSFILMQAPSGTFKDTPNVENALYDWYEMHPQYKGRGSWTLKDVDPFYETTDKIVGEWTLMSRQLIKTGTNDHFVYHLRVWLDQMLGCPNPSPPPDRMIKVPYAFAVSPFQSEGAPAVNFSVAGQRLATTSVGLWGAEKYSDALHGFVQVSGEPVTDIPWETIWQNHFTLTIEVNDPSMGTTNPAPASYTEYATDYVLITALPNAGYHVDHWERDGVTCGTGNTYSVYMLKDYTVKCVFAPD